MSYIERSASSSGEDTSSYESSSEENILTTDYRSISMPVNNNNNSNNNNNNNNSTIERDRDILKAKLAISHPLRPISKPMPSMINSSPSLLSSYSTTNTMTTKPTSATTTTTTTAPLSAPICREMNQNDRDRLTKLQSPPTTTQTNSLPPFTPFTIGGLLGCHHHQNGDKKKKTVPKVLAPFSTGCLECAHEKKEKEMLEGGEDDEERNFKAKPSQSLTSDQRQYYGIPERSDNQGLKSRMLATNAYFSKISSLNMQSLMSTGKVMPLGNANHCSIDEVARHIRDSHPDFYELLQKNTLLPVVFKSEVSPEVIIIIPSHKALQEAVDTSEAASEATRRLLLYHVLKRGSSPVPQKVIGMLTYETLLEGKTVQIEEDRGAYRINGYELLRSDYECPYNIFHIRGLLNPDEEQPSPDEDEPAVGDDGNNDQPPQTTENEAASESDDEGGGGGADANAETTVKSRIPFNITSFNAVDTKTVFNNQILSQVTAQMSRSYYNGNLDFTDHKIKSPVNASNGKTKPVSVAIVTFNTKPLFKEYSKQCLREMSFVVTDKCFNLTFPEGDQKHFNYEKSLPFTEYRCKGTETPIKKSDLIGENKLVGLSFTSPTEDRLHSVMLCKLKAGTGGGGNVFISQGENLLLRFKSSGELDTISINHAASSVENGGGVMDGLKKEAFLEFDTQALEKTLYNNALDSEGFDHLLMTNAKISKYLKKRAHDAKKGAGKLIRKGNRLMKKTAANEVKPAPRDSIPEDIDERLATGGADWNDGTATVMLFSNGFHHVEPKNGRSTFQYKRKTILVGNNDSVDVLQFIDGNGIGNNIGEKNPGKYMTLQLSGSPTMTLRVRRVTPQTTNKVFYAGVESKLYVFQFSSSGDLSKILVMLKSSSAAIRIIAASK